MSYVSSRRFVFCFLFVLFTFHCQATSAQDLDTAGIAGRVTDQNSAVIQDASIQVTLVSTGLFRKTRTDADGHYHLIQLEPGILNIHVAKQGFAPYDVKNLSLLSAQQLHLDVTLLPDVVNVDPITITVTDVAKLDTRRTLSGGTLTPRESESLPIASRSILDLIFTLAGITEEPFTNRDLAEDRNASTANTPEEAGTFAIAGAPAYSNNLTIDGLDNNDDRGARERFQPSIEAVEEVQVITNQFSAEYGRASGGRINLRTRAGSKNFRGRFFYFFRDEALDANTFNNNSRGFARLPLQEHDYGFTFGGPLKFRWLNEDTFFFSFENDRVLDTALIDTVVPVLQNPAFPLPGPTHVSVRRVEMVTEPSLAAEIAPFVSRINTPLKSTNVLVRFDHRFTDMHNATVTYQMGRLNNLRQFGGANRLADALQGKRRNSDGISYSDNFVFSPQLLNQFRLQFSHLAPVLAAIGWQKPVVLINVKDSLLTAGSATLVAGSSTAGATDRSENRFQLQNIASYLRGAHSFRFGFDLQRVRSTFIDLSDATGTFNFASAGDFLASTPTRFRQSFQNKSIQENTYSGLFLQDEWQLTPQLLVSFGVRYERETIVRDHNNFGPRAAIAFSPFASQRVALRMGGGIFYNRALLRTIDDFTLGKQQVTFDSNSLIDPTTGKLMSADARRIFLATHLRFPDTLGPDSALVQEFGVVNKAFSRRLSSSLRIPSSYQSNAGAEIDLGHSFSLELNYTINRGIHLWREFNANAPRLPAGYHNFSQYLASRDFANFVNTTTATRPIYNVSGAGELVRFMLRSPSGSNPNAITRVVEFGVPVSVFNLDAVSSTTTLNVALAALNELRSDPSRAEVEELISAGNSFYRGFTIELRRSVLSTTAGFNFRAAYTLSHLIDDGVVNTSDALQAGDFRSERARSLLDRRHRFTLSGTFRMPASLGSLQLSPLLRATSNAPFNVSIGGIDRNLDDVGNDRPNFAGDVSTLLWRSPGQTPATNIDQFALPLIGQSGNLPRNAGRGPGQFLFDLSVTRDWCLKEDIILRPVIEFDNVLNKTVFSFGSEFINFGALSPTVSAEQRAAFVDGFLLATRTMRPRQIRLGLRLEF
ncbi:MAG: TonB-dependent receptor domain-containing protein [Pyrinomonadaceae bacterium]